MAQLRPNLFLWKFPYFRRRGQSLIACNAVRGQFTTMITLVHIKLAATGFQHGWRPWKRINSKSCNVATLQLYNSKILQLCNFTTLILWYFATLQLFNFAILQLYNFTTLQLYNFTTLQLYNLNFQHWSFSTWKHFLSSLDLFRLTCKIFLIYTFMVFMISFPLYYFP